MTNQGLQTLFQILMAIGIILTAIGGYGSYHFGQRDQQETKAQQPTYSGLIVAANESGPELPRDVPPDTVQFLLGDDLRVLAVKSENYILSRRGKPFLSIVISNGTMRIKTTVFDSHNRYIVRIINNEFQVSQENAFNPKQPDKHSLIVRDTEGIEVLNIRFINEKVIRIVGRFHLEGLEEPIIILPEEGIRWPGGGGIANLTVDLTQSKSGFLDIGQ